MLLQMNLKIINKCSIIFHKTDLYRDAELASSASPTSPLLSAVACCNISVRRADFSPSSRSVARDRARMFLCGGHGRSQDTQYTKEW